MYSVVVKYEETLANGNKKYYEIFRNCSDTNILINNLNLKTGNGIIVTKSKKHVDITFSKNINSVPDVWRYVIEIKNQFFVDFFGLETNQNIF